MSSASSHKSQRVKDLNAELEQLRKKMAVRHEELRRIEHERLTPADNILPFPRAVSLTQHEISRYSRQLIMPELGVAGQLRLKNASVLVVGTGGLGCAAALHLAGAGVGRIGLVDADVVELNNLHRQLLHAESAIGRAKAESGKESLARLNSAIRIDVHNLQLNTSNALPVLGSYDVLLDATDNVPTRYLLSDAAVLLQRPLVSGSALRLEGQLTVYNHANGPCYRCVFPVPPSPALVTNCGDAGVLGPVVGVIGTLQALEAIKIVLGHGRTLAGKLLLFDAADTQFRTIGLRERRADCAVCGERPSIIAPIDYEEFCGSRADDKVHNVYLLPQAKRIGVEELKQLRSDGEGGVLRRPFVLVDVRPKTEFEIGSIEGAVNVPLDTIAENRLEEGIRKRLLDDEDTVVVVCLRGNDSQRAVLQLDELLAAGEGPKPRQKVVCDVVGGLKEWHRLIDSTFPIY